jgi:hypothetical protein
MSIRISDPQELRSVWDTEKRGNVRFNQFKEKGPDIDLKPYESIKKQNIKKAPIRS